MNLRGVELLALMGVHYNAVMIEFHLVSMKEHPHTRALVPDSEIYCFPCLERAREND